MLGGRLRGALQRAAAWLAAAILLCESDGTPEEVRKNPDVISAYLGTSH